MSSSEPDVDEAAEVDAGGRTHDDNSDADVPEPSRGRKRTRNPEVWKKMLQNTGEMLVRITSV